MTERATLNDLTLVDVELDHRDTVRTPPLFLESSPCASLEELYASLQGVGEKESTSTT